MSGQFFNRPLFHYEKPLWEPFDNCLTIICLQTYLDPSLEVFGKNFRHFGKGSFRKAEFELVKGDSLLG